MPQTGLRQKRLGNATFRTAGGDGGTGFERSRGQVAPQQSREGVTNLHGCSPLIVSLLRWKAHDLSVLGSCLSCKNSFTNEAFASVLMHDEKGLANPIVLNR